MSKRVRPYLSVIACCFLFVLIGSGKVTASEGTSDPENGVLSRSGQAAGTRPIAVVSRAPDRPARGAATGNAAGTSSNSRELRRGSLPPYAEELAKAIRFDRRVLLIVKGETNERIQRLVGYDAEGYQLVSQGISVSIPREKADRVLATLRRKLVPLKYQPFVVEINKGLKTGKIGVIKGTDQYDILRTMLTNGEHDGIANSDIVERLKEWEKGFSFNIVGADNNWVEIEFRTLPKDLKIFSEEVNVFSPDAVDNGPGTVEGLVKEIRKTRRLFLRWD